MAHRPDTPLVRQLTRQITNSGLSINDFARWVFGTSERTLHNWLRGDIPASDRANWIMRLERVELHGDQLVITVRRGAVGMAWKRKRAAAQEGGSNGE